MFQEEVFDDKQSAMVLKNCSFSRSNLVEMAGGPKNGLKDVTLAIRKGELVGLLGGMASGKSTLVNKSFLAIFKLYVEYILLNAGFFHLSYEIRYLCKYGSTLVIWTHFVLLTKRYLKLDWDFLVCKTKSIVWLIKNHYLLRTVLPVSNLHC